MKTLFTDNEKTKMKLYIILSLIGCALISAGLYFCKKETHPFVHCVYYFFIFMIIFAIVNPWSVFYKIKIRNDKLFYISTVCTAIAISLLCVIPMGINPIWNGEIPEHRNQYEELADAFLEGHLDVHIEDDVSMLSSLENPYDPNARAELNVPYQWDHVFYNGHYYVYFGVIPAVVLFLPYRFIVGVPLETWKATAFFSVFIILAYFLLGYKVIKKIQADIPLVVYLVLCSSLSCATLWYAVKYPALYCTAIVSGICFALWAIYFTIDAFFIDDSPTKWKIFAGALCGALVFGCRPPIGFSEIVLFPIIFCSIKKQLLSHKEIKNVMKQIIIFSIPYILIAVCLITYNYVRFENPFEFGQSYQLTAADQTQYLNNILGRLSIVDWINWIGNYFLDFHL